MKTLHEVEKAVEGLTSEQLEEFAVWFYQLQDRIWQKEVESGSSKLDALAEQALKDFDQGKCTKL